MGAYSDPPPGPPYPMQSQSQELLPKFIEQDAKQGPSSQFADRRAGWEWAVSFKLSPAPKSCVGCVYVRRCADKHILPISCLPHAARRGAAHRSAIQGLRSGRSVTQVIYTLHSVHRVEHVHVVRLEAVLLSLHVAIELSKIRRSSGF